MAEHNNAAVFLCYKQEHFVEEALRSVLAQKEPLHVWVLDDASPDGTWRVILACLESQQSQSAAHTIEKFPAATNGGLARNWNRVIPHLREQWIHVFEGDDISMVERVASADRFAKAHPAMAVFSSRVLQRSATAVSEEPASGSGGVFDADTVLARGFPELPGCSLVLRRDIFTVFGRLNWRLLTVDYVLIRRGFMLGDVGLLEEPLVVYRKHEANVSRMLVVRLDSMRAFQDSMLVLQRHTLGSLHETRKLWRFARRNCAADSARSRIAWRIYQEARAHALLGLACTRRNRLALFHAALSNLLNNRERRLSKWALALALWSGSWSSWQTAKSSLRAVLRKPVEPY